MDKMMSCKEAADMWNFTERWVSIMCKEGKIPGAVKQGHRWMLPLDSKRPVDNRVKSGAYRKEGTPASLPPALGVTDYKKACTEYFYVDKTYVIKEFLDNPVYEDLQAVIGQTNYGPWVDYALHTDILPANRLSFRLGNDN